MIKIATIAALVAGSISFAQAQTVSTPRLAQIEGASVDLGTTRGSAYYVDAPDGYHLIATLISGGSYGPVRFETVLADGQSATVSIPGPSGAPAQAVTFRRSAGHLEVRDTPDQDRLFHKVAVTQ